MIDISFDFVGTFTKCQKT